MKMLRKESRFAKVVAWYLFDDPLGRVLIGKRAISTLIPSATTPDLLDAILISQSKTVIAAYEDVGEEHVYVLNVDILSFDDG